MYFKFLWLILPLFLTLVSEAKQRIQLDMRYNSSGHEAVNQQKTVLEGESFESQFGRGDIDTVISMTPSLETNRGQPVVMVDVSIQNFRDGDLISESNPQIIAQPGQRATVSVRDSDLDEEYKLSVNASVLR